MAWLTLQEALDALRQRFEDTPGFSPAQRVLMVDIIYRWQQELRTQERAPGERRKCAECGNTVPPQYVVVSQRNPSLLMCPACWMKTLSDADCADLFEERTLHFHLYNPDGTPISFEDVLRQMRGGL
jgi:hypothetical protein